MILVPMLTDQSKQQNRITYMLQTKVVFITPAIFIAGHSCPIKNFIKLCMDLITVDISYPSTVQAILE